MYIYVARCRSVNPTHMGGVVPSVRETVTSGGDRNGSLVWLAVGSYTGVICSGRQGWICILQFPVKCVPFFVRDIKRDAPCSRDKL